jgi:hypothetical protein
MIRSGSSEICDKLPAPALTPESHEQPPAEPRRAVSGPWYRRRKPEQQELSLLLGRDDWGVTFS